MRAPADLYRLEQAIAELANRIETLQDASVAQAQTAGNAQPQEWPEQDRAEHIIALREALKDLGARMAMLTLLREGDGSPIPALIREAQENPEDADARSGIASRSIAQRIQGLRTEAEGHAPAPAPRPPARP